MLYQGYSGHDQMAAVLCQFNLSIIDHSMLYLKDFFFQIPKANECPQGQGSILAIVIDK